MEGMWCATENVLSTVKTVEREVGDAYADGGRREQDEIRDGQSVETTGTGAIGGAVAVGAVGGAADAIGGAVLWEILGDEVEKRSLRR
jgi:hypothetical protein